MDLGTAFSKQETKLKYINGSIILATIGVLVVYVAGAISQHVEAMRLGFDPLGGLGGGLVIAAIIWVEFQVKQETKT